MDTGPFVPHHIKATADDLAGNGALGRYVLLPGSDGRAREIAQRFESVVIRPSARAHNLYLGRLKVGKKHVDVASVCSGMGTPSLDIIANELFRLGARRILRVGTAGSLQPDYIRVGDLVVATAAVRDENTSRLYVPPEYPAVASAPMVAASHAAAHKLRLGKRTRYGIIHAKDSLFAREFGEGPMKERNQEYMRLLHDSGVVASEMESSHLFVLASLFSHQLRLARATPPDVLAGTVLGIIGDDRPFAPSDEADKAVELAVELALETIRQLAQAEGA